MGKKNLIITIVCEQGYVRNIENKDVHAEENILLFDAISQTYLPLLNLINNFDKRGFDAKIALVLSPQLCALLNDSEMQKLYVKYLDEKILLGQKELERNKNNESLLKLINSYIEKAKKDKEDFTELYECHLIQAFDRAAKNGFIEVLATSATYSYLPHYADLTEALNAQIETGLRSQRYFFGEMAEGFYLPHLGYSNGLDKVLRSYGVNYTIADARSFLFSNDKVENGIFSPLRTENSLVLFARDPDCPEEIMADANNSLNGEDGYALKDIYRCERRDIGFDLNLEDLKPLVGKDDSRIPTGFKYWSNEGDEAFENDQGPFYDQDAALEEAKKDARDFYAKKEEKLLKAEELLKGQDVNLLLTIPGELLGQKWHEGFTFFEEFMNLCHASNKINLALPKELLQNQFTLPKFTPYPCSAGGHGYGEDLLDDKNKWMFRYIRKATERMIDLTERFPAESGLKERLLNLAAKEVLLAQSSDWPLMLTKNQLPEYAEKMFTKNIISFTNVFSALASNTVSTEWLTKLEKEHALFPWINYKIFSRKK